nr:unnamed protein product [Spirometra erinaceieuropaei]
MQDPWMARKTEEIQGANGSTLPTENILVFRRWAEHFREVLKRPSTISDARTSPVVRNALESASPTGRTASPQNHRRMHFQSRVSITTVHELLFADDCALKATSGEHMQMIMDLFDASCENFGLVINTEKTVIMHQLPPGTAYVAAQIPVNSTQLQSWTTSCIWAAPPPAIPRSTMKCLAGSPKPAKPSAVCKRSLESPYLHLNTKLKMHKALFSTETEIEMAGPDAGHGCNKADGNTQHIRHAETTETALERVDDERLPIRLIYDDIAKGFRQKGGQVCRHKDTLKTSLKRLQINPANWEDLARDRLSWERTMKTGAAIYEDNRINAAKAKRKARKSALHPPLNANA